jgi:hypothetical protein
MSEAAGMESPKNGRKLNGSGETARNSTGGDLVSLVL